MTRADRLLLLAILCALPWLYWTIWSSPQQGQWVRIWSPDKTMTLPLHENNTVQMGGPLGDSVIRIQDGQVRFTHSPCSGKACVRSGWLHQSGEVSACLPNQVSIQVLGANPRYDAVNF